jgi:mono/diheme cytochrome c family protein/cytochrome c551/c552
MSTALAVAAFIVVPAMLFLFIFGTWVPWMRRLIFPLLSFALLALIGIAAYRDNNARGYLAIQDQYKADYYKNDQSAFNSNVQQLFPAFSAAKVGDTFRTERCISCHAPDIATVGPQIASQRLASDFMKYEPNARQIIEQYHLCEPVATCTPTHPAFVTATDAQAAKVNGVSYQTYGQYDPATGKGVSSFTYTNPTTGKQSTIPEAGYIQTVIDPSNPASNASQGQLGIDQTGCIVCHNGSRLALDQTSAHQNLIVNPQYSWSEGAALYYGYTSTPASCVSCHGVGGLGGVGPPLSNQDRLGFFNEDYYYRCIEYGLTGFEHYNSVMPNWGSIASDYASNGSPLAANAVVNQKRVLSETQINILIQFIRHWENYSTLP